MTKATVSTNSTQCRTSQLVPNFTNANRDRGVDVGLSSQLYTVQQVEQKENGYINMTPIGCNKTVEATPGFNSLLQQDLIRSGSLSSSPIRTSTTLFSTSIQEQKNEFKEKKSYVEVRANTTKPSLTTHQAQTNI